MDFCGVFLYEKMAVWMNAEVRGLITLWLIPVKRVCYEQSVSLKFVRNRTQKCGKYNKERWWHRTN